MPFKGSGCYAEGIRTVKTWERADDESDLCAKDRDAIVVFGIHGAHKSKARKAIQIHRDKLK